MPIYKRVSTHSRPKAAGWGNVQILLDSFYVSTHSRPKAAGFSYARFLEKFMVSTHSRPKAAGV